MLGMINNQKINTPLYFDGEKRLHARPLSAKLSSQTEKNVSSERQTKKKSLSIWMRHGFPSEEKVSSEHGRNLSCFARLLLRRFHLLLLQLEE